MPDAQFAAEAGAAAHTFVDALDDDLVVDGDDGHHLGRSLRLRPGEAVTAADGSGSWRRYVVRANDRSRVELEADSVIIGEPRLDPALAVAFALTKGVKPDLVVQKLTELGADRVVVVRTQRSVPRWDESRAAAAIDRLARIA